MIIWSGVFFCAAYSEALFCALTFSGLLFLAIVISPEVEREADTMQEYDSRTHMKSLGLLTLPRWFWGWAAACTFLLFYFLKYCMTEYSCNAMLFIL